MKKIPLTQGKYALVDNSDFEYLSQWKWCAHKRSGNFYSERTEIVGGKKKQVLMHRLILNAPAGILVDHEDGNGLNCQRYNIRLATSSQNSSNKRKRASATSKYKGVYAHPNGKYKVTLSLGGKNFHGGYHAKEKDAAKAYDVLASKLFGEFARLNFP